MPEAATRERAHLGHQAEIEDAYLAVQRADEVAWVRVRVEVPRLQQLDQVGVQQRRAQLAHVRCTTFAQLLACARCP